jgi:hypothetical protein
MVKLIPPWLSSETSFRSWSQADRPPPVFLYREADIEIV